MLGVDDALLVGEHAGGIVGEFVAPIDRCVNTVGNGGLRALARSIGRCSCCLRSRGPTLLRDAMRPLPASVTS